MARRQQRHRLLFHAVGDTQRFVIRVGTREHRAEVTGLRGQIGDHPPMMITVDGTRFGVFAAPGGGILVRACEGTEQSMVHLDQQAWAHFAALAGHSVALDIKTEQAVALASARQQSSHQEGSGFSVRAPMPGRIIRILVQNGQSVEQNTPLLLVEAMKMENEIHAPGKGIIQNLTIKEGTTVEAGQLLCEIHHSAPCSQ